MSEKDIVTWLWALVGAAAAIASLQLVWPVSVAFFALGVGALIMAYRTERS
jgi:hypothetical protein